MPKRMTWRREPVSGSISPSARSKKSSPNSSNSEENSPTSPAGSSKRALACARCVMCRVEAAWPPAMPEEERKQPQVCRRCREKVRQLKLEEAESFERK